jgi:hypothetical protein
MKIFAKIEQEICVSAGNWNEYAKLCRFARNRRIDGRRMPFPGGRPACHPDDAESSPSPRTPEEGPMQLADSTRAARRSPPRASVSTNQAAPLVSLFDEWEPRTSKFLLRMQFLSRNTNGRDVFDLPGILKNSSTACPGRMPVQAGFGLSGAVGKIHGI